MTTDVFALATNVSCTCGRVGGHRHDILPGCPGLDGPVQFIQGPQPGTIIASSHPQRGPGKTNADGTVTLIPLTPAERQAIGQLQGSANQDLSGLDTAELVQRFLDHWELAIEPAHLTYLDRRRKLRVFARENPTLPTTAQEVADWLRHHYPNPTSTRQRSVGPHRCLLCVPRR